MPSTRLRTLDLAALMRHALLLLILPVLLACGEPADSPGPAGAGDVDVAALRQAAAGGNAEAQYQLAMRYVSGAGAVPDEIAALAWMRRAAERGYAPAQYELGSFYTLDRPTRDDRQAALWLRKAAEQGHAAAQYSLGRLYAAGRGVPADPAEAYVWLSLAADANDPDAVQVRDRVALLIREVDFERARRRYGPYREKYARRP